jgi:hypothetical protein
MNETKEILNNSELVERIKKSIKRIKKRDYGTSLEDIKKEFNI